LNALWYYAIGFIVIWVLALLFRKQLKIDIEGPLLMRKTTRLRGFIDSVANKSPRFWRWTMNVGIPVSVFFMGLMVYALVLSLQIMFNSPSVAIVLPGVDIPGSPIFVPLGYGIIALAILMVVHEFGHGIISRVEGVKIKSIGVLMFAILPGAFVEPDEEDVKKSSRISKLRIYAAGSTFNLIVALIAFLIMTGMSTFLIDPSFHSDGMEITSVVSNGPSTGILSEGMVIYSINGYTVKDITDFIQVMNKTAIGQTVTIQTDKGTYTVKTAPNPTNSSKSYVGVRSQNPHLVVNEGVSKSFGNLVPWIFPIKDLLYWIFLLNFLVGTFNLLPMKPLDGGLIFEELLRYKLPEDKVKLIVTNVSWILIAIVVVLVVYGTVPGILKMI
jgi:membrane-associated protease RseP (regulator of RpoE activity)